MYQERKVELEDVSIHYLEWGVPGETPVLMLHGYLDVAHGWVPFAECLGEGYHRIAPNFRGHGKSGWSEGYSYTFYNYIYDWVQLLEHLKWDKFILIGHSMGANCASVFAGTFPERVEKLVLLEGFGIPGSSAEDSPDILAYHIERRKPETRKRNKVFATFDDVVARLLKSNPAYPREHAEMLAREGARPLENGQWTWRFDERMRLPNPVIYFEDQFRAFWKRIQAPTLQVIGKGSAFAGMAEPGYWNIPNMEIVEIENAGHMIQHDAPEELGRCVQRFLKKAI